MRIHKLYLSYTVKTTATKKKGILLEVLNDIKNLY